MKHSATLPRLSLEEAQDLQFHLVKLVRGHAESFFGID